MNVERIKDLPGIAQNLLISLAVVIGGAWTIFMFWTERPDRRAEREAFAQPIINVEVVAKQIDMDDKGGLYVFAVAKLNNHGNKTGVLDLTETPPFRISRIMFSGDRIAVGELQAPIAARNVTGTKSAELGARAYGEYHVFVRVAEPGHYYVAFLAPLAKSDFHDDKRSRSTPRIGGAPPGWKSRSATPRRRPSKRVRNDLWVEITK